MTGTAAADHRRGNVDLVLRIGSGTIAPSLWYSDGRGYFHRSFHPRSRFRHGLRTETRITRRGFIERLYISRGRIIDAEIIGRIDRYGNRRFFRQDHRYSHGHGRRSWRYDGWYGDDFGRRHTRRDHRRDHRYDRRRGENWAYEDSRQGDDNFYWDERDSRDDRRRDLADERRNERQDSRGDGVVRGRIMPDGNRPGASLDERLASGRDLRGEVLEREEDLRVRNKGDRVTGRVIYPD
jgi:hypothetical protein